MSTVLQKNFFTMSQPPSPLLPIPHTIPTDKSTPQVTNGLFSPLLLGFSVIFLIWYLRWHWKRRYLYLAASKIKGPKWIPFIGNALRFAGSTEDILLNVNKLCNEFETPVPVWLAHRLFFGISKAEDLEVILNSPRALEKEDLYKYSQPLIGMGLFAAPVKIWKAHRKAIAPTFNQKILDTFVEIFSEQSLVMVNCLKEDIGKECNIGERFGRLSLDTISESALGTKLNSQTTERSIGHKFERALAIMFKRMFQIWYHSDFIFSLTSMYGEEKRILADIHNLTDEIVKEKKEQYRLKKMEENDNVVIEETGFKRKPFLDLLIELSEEGINFTDTDLRNEATTFIVAGSDTTATVESFVTVCLGLYPEIQERVYKEVVDIIGLDRPVVKEDLPEMKYLERVIKETMRFFPIGPCIVRKITEDLEISNKIVLPADSSPVLAIYVIHFNPKYWTDPWTFDPDRFLPEVAAKRHPYAYLPFSAGPRNCIGPKYAMMAMKVAIASIIRKYRVFTYYKNIKDVRVKQDLIIKPVDGYKIRIEERQ